MQLSSIGCWVVFSLATVAHAQSSANPLAGAAAATAQPKTGVQFASVAGYTDRNVWASSTAAPPTLVDFDTLADGTLTTGTGALAPWGIADTFGTSANFPGPVDQFVYCSCSLNFPMFTAGTLPTEPNYFANRRDPSNYATGEIRFVFSTPTTACGAYVADGSPLSTFTIEIFDGAGASLGLASLPTSPMSFVGVVSTLPFASAEFRSDSPGDSWGLDSLELVQNSPTPTVYCTAGTTSHGCNATIDASANPSAAFANACDITVIGVEGQRTGILFYGLSALPQPWCTPAGASFLCVKPPTQRSFAGSSGGALNQCNGSFALDWNAFQQSTPGALGAPWTVGDRVYVQAWFRDPPACRTTSLSNAVELTYLP